MDDLKAAELITRKITEGLNQQEEAELEEHLSQSAMSRDFAQWSTRIQEVIEIFRHPDASASEGPGLDPVTRQRLEKRLLETLRSAGWEDTDASSRAHPGQRPADIGNELTDRRKVAENQLDYKSDWPIANDEASHQDPNGDEDTEKTE